jgi:hypothetical protein
MNRHKGLEWTKVQANLEANTEKLWSLNEMERTGGEPEVFVTTAIDAPRLFASFRDEETLITQKDAAIFKLVGVFVCGILNFEFIVF